MNRSTHLNVGRITGPHGIRGAVRVWDYSPDPDLFRAGRVLTGVLPDGSSRSFRVLEAGTMNKGLRLTLDGVRTREDSEALKNTELWVSREELPPLTEGEVYLEDLPGFTLHDLATGSDLGPVISVEENPGHAHLIVRYRDVEVMVPLVPEIVESYDTKAKRVLARLPEGLVDIYLDAAKAEAEKSAKASQRPPRRTGKDTIPKTADKIAEKTARKATGKNTD